MSFLASSFVSADLQVKDVGWNTYKWGDGKYYINDVLAYHKPVDLTPDETALNENKCWSENRVYTLAFFSNMVSLKIGGNEMCSGMAHPNHWADVSTYRVNKGKVEEVSLSDLFSTDVILEQLYKDSYLTKKYPVDTKAHIKSDFEKINDVCEAVDSTTLSNFSIHHIKEGQIAIRLFLKPCGGPAIMNKQIGFYLPAYGPLFEAIQLSSEKKLLMKDLSPD